MLLVKLLRFLRAFFVYCLVYLFKRKELNYMRKWYETLPIRKGSEMLNFCVYFSYLKEFRSVLYWQLGDLWTFFLKFIAPQHSTLYLRVEKERVGNGLVVQHGNSTRISAERIGDNCQIWQNVTIGKKYSGGKTPIIGDNVRIYAGAVVLGDIIVGNNVQIGANSVVIKSVPDDCVVAGNPAKIIRRNGQRVDN